MESSTKEAKGTPCQQSNKVWFLLHLCWYETCLHSLFFYTNQKGVVCKHRSSNQVIPQKHPEISFDNQPHHVNCSYVVCFKFERKIIPNKSTSRLLDMNLFRSMALWIEGKSQNALNPIITFAKSSPFSHWIWLLKTTWIEQMNFYRTKCIIDLPMVNKSK